MGRKVRPILSIPLRQIMMMTTKRLKLLIHGAVWFLLGWLVWDWWAGNLSVNPIQEVTQRTGKYALVLLVLSLAATPVNTFFGFRPALQVRRLLGLYAFLFAALHFMIFIGWDYGFDWGLIAAAIVEKRFVVAGLSAFVILLALAATSFKSSQKRLGKNWKRLHRLAYLAGILVVVHYTWATKGDLLRLQGDILQPLVFGGIVLLLLLARLPAVRRAASNLRTRRATRSASVPLRSEN